MACLLKPDPLPGGDVVGTAGTEPRVFIKSDASLNATVLAASLGDQDIDVSEKVFTLPALKGGVNVLNLVIDGVEVDDDVQLMEDCGGGETRLLKKKFVGSAGGGISPHLGFSIDAE
jgi:hypothetical protein